MHVMNIINLQTVAEFNVQKQWARATVFYPSLKKYACPKTEISRRMKTTAGYAFYLPVNIVRFSAELMHEHTQNFIDDTIPHEVAHIVANNVFGAKGHGAAWKRVMLALGVNPTRLHSMVNSKWEAQKAGVKL